MTYSAFCFDLLGFTQGVVQVNLNELWDSLHQPESPNPDPQPGNGETV